MTVESLQTKQIYEGNGAATVFPVPFSYNQTDTLKLIFTSAAGEDVDVTENFQVNVSGDGDTSITYPLEGEPIPVGTRLTIYRQTPLTQIVDLIYGGAFNPDVQEHDALDRAVLMIQELSERTERSLQWPITTDPGDMESPGEYLAQVNAARDVAVSAAGSAGDSAADSATSAGASGAAASAAAQSAAEARDIAENFMENVPLVSNASNGGMPKFEGAPHGSLAHVGVDGIEYGELLPRLATQEEVNTGVVDSTQPGWTRPFVGVRELAVACTPIIKIFTESDSYTTTRDCLIRATIVDGGQGGGRGGGGSGLNGSSSVAGKPGCVVMAAFACNGGVTIPIQVGDGGAGAAAANYEGVPVADGDFGGTSSVGDGVTTPLIQTHVGIYGWGNSPFSVNARRTSTGVRTAGGAGVRYYLPVINSGAVGAGGTITNTSTIELGGDGGSAGWLPAGVDLEIPKSGGGGYGSENGTAYGGAGAVGFGAGGAGGGTVARSGRAVCGAGGAGAPGLVILEIF